MAAVGESAGDASTVYLTIFVFTLITYISNFLKILSVIYFMGCLTYIIFIILTLTEIAGFLGLIITYGMSHFALKKVDKQALQYAVDNNCSDAVLQRSISQYLNNYDHDLMLIGLGFFFVVTSFTFIYGSLIVFGPCRPLFAKCCKGLSEPTRFERKMTAMKSNVAQRYQTFRSRNKKPEEVAGPPVDVLGPGGELKQNDIDVKVDNQNFVLSEPIPPPSMNYNI